MWKPCAFYPTLNKDFWHFEGLKNSDFPSIFHRNIEKWCYMFSAPASINNVAWVCPYGIIRTNQRRDNYRGNG